MSEWITDREPKRTDADDEQKLVWVMSRGNAVLRPYYNVARGQPWKPIVQPEPYVKPRRYRVTVLTIERWCVIDREARDFAAKYLPTKEAAERIAAIYNEVMP